jgi:hypothetical protein
MELFGCARKTGTPLPACLKSKFSYHSRYLGRIRDLPWQGSTFDRRQLFIPVDDNYSSL